MLNTKTMSLVMAAGLGTLLAITPAKADDAADAAYKDIEATLGQVPDMLKTMPEVGIAGAWAEIKSVQLNPDTALDGKTRVLPRRAAGQSDGDTTGQPGRPVTGSVVTAWRKCDALLSATSTSAG